MGQQKNKNNNNKKQKNKKNKNKNKKTTKKKNKKTTKQQQNQKKTKKKQQITTKKKSENITYFAGIQVVFLTLVFSHVSDFHFRNTLSDFFTQQVSKMRKSENRNIDIFETVSKQKAFKRRLTRWHRRERPNDTPSRTPHTESYPMIYLTSPHYGGTH